MTLTRREALHRLSLVLGGAISAPTLSALLSGCTADAPPPGWTPQVLSGDQLNLLTTLVDRIIPATDTPGASDVGVPAFIDRLLAEWLDPEDRDRFLAGLDSVGDELASLPAEVQGELLARLDAEAVAAREAEVDPLPFFATLKEVTLVGYYTSEAGATEELQWLPLPGRYDGDAPLEEIGRTWA